MAEKKQKKQINVYEVAGKVGKGVKKVGGIALGAGITLLTIKGPDLLNKIKRS